MLSKAWYLDWLTNNQLIYLTCLWVIPINHFWYHLKFPWSSHRIIPQHSNWMFEIMDNQELIFYHRGVSMSIQFHNIFFTKRGVCSLKMKLINSCNCSDFVTCSHHQKMSQCLASVRYFSYWTWIDKSTPNVWHCCLFHPLLCPWNHPYLLPLSCIP